MGTTYHIARTVCMCIYVRYTQREHRESGTILANTLTHSFMYIYIYIIARERHTVDDTVKLYYGMCTFYAVLPRMRANKANIIRFIVVVFMNRHLSPGLTTLFSIPHTHRFVLYLKCKMNGKKIERDTEWDIAKVRGCENRHRGNTNNKIHKK